MKTREEELRASYPDIEWDDPIHVTLGSGSGYACRYCIAMHGLNKSIFTPGQTVKDVSAHITDTHL